MAKVLIVDDEPETVELLKTATSLFGHDAIGVMSGSDALACMANDPPDIVLLDLMMPGMDGYEVLEAMRIDDRLCAVPVLVVTASQDLDLGQKVDAAGGNGFLKKPVRMETLNEAIREHLFRLQDG